MYKWGDQAEAKWSPEKGMAVVRLLPRQDLKDGELWPWEAEQCFSQKELRVWVWWGVQAKELKTV